MFCDKPCKKHKKSLSEAQEAFIKLEKQKQVRGAYSKHGKGKTLSPDRKNNNKGYGASNTRMVPKELNHGRHKVDTKKLKSWKDKVKKSDMTFNNLKTFLLSKAIDKNNEELVKVVENLTYNSLIDLLHDK